MSFPWWYWILLGLVLVVFEIAAPGGFYFIFFGVGALLVGALAAADAGGPLWVQILLFSVLSLGSLLLFRARLLGALQKGPASDNVDSLVKEVGTVSEDLAPGAVGKVELRGSAWTAKNVSQTPLARGARCVVLRVDGLTLHVGPEGASS
jgi:membrane protein implicated in regulation of membrane protease activity